MGNETCCAICIENFETGSQVRYLTCGHPYHKKCIDPWLIEKGSCPQCKVDVLKQLGLRDGDSNETTVNFSVTQQPTVDMNTNPAFTVDLDDPLPTSEIADSGVEDEGDDDDLQRRQSL